MLAFLSNLFQTGPDGVSPGLATTEFLTTAVGAAVILFGLHLSDPQKAAAITLLGLAYVAFRSVVKAYAAGNPPAK